MGYNIASDFVPIIKMLKIEYSYILWIYYHSAQETTDNDQSLSISLAFVLYLYFGVVHLHICTHTHPHTHTPKCFTRIKVLHIPEVLSF